MTLTCKAVQVRLPSIDDQAYMAGPLAAHRGSCLACQAEAARYRRLYRSLVALSESVQSAPSGLAAAVDARLARVTSAAAVASARAARIAATAGAVVAAAGTLVMVRWMKARSAA